MALRDMVRLVNRGLAGNARSQSAMEHNLELADCADKLANR
jgi:hypothetical protein